MKKLFFLLAMLGAMPFALHAQDDMYFTPTKVDKNAPQTDWDAPAYYSGSDRDVDEYNRRGNYRVIGKDSLGTVHNVPIKGCFLTAVMMDIEKN